MDQPSTKIEFYKQRDLGEKINVTFDFLRKNFKEIFMLLLKTVLPILAVVVIIPAFFPEYFISDYKSIQDFNVSTPFVMMIYYFAYVYASIYATSTFLTVLYNKTMGEDQDLNITKQIRSNMSSIFVVGLLAGLIIIGCLLLLIIPGIIVAVMLSFVTTVVVFEKVSPSRAISRCWKLGTTEWWPTLGLIIVVGLISGIVNTILSAPNLIVNTIAVLTHMNTMGSSITFKIILYLTTLLSAFGGVLISSISIIALSFQYANIREIKEGYSLQDKITNFEEQQ